MSTAAREKGRLPNRIIWSPSLESSTLSSTEEQCSNEAFNAATSLALGFVSAILATGEVVYEFFEHRPLFDCEICMTTCANDFISAVGFKLNLYAGIDCSRATILIWNW